MNIPIGQFLRYVMKNSKRTETSSSNNPTTGSDGHTKSRSISYKNTHDHKKSYCYMRLLGYNNNETLRTAYNNKFKHLLDINVYLRKEYEKAKSENDDDESYNHLTIMRRYYMPKKSEYKDFFDHNLIERYFSRSTGTNKLAGLARNMSKSEKGDEMNSDLLMKITSGPALLFEYS